MQPDFFFQQVVEERSFKCIHIGLYLQPRGKPLPISIFLQIINIFVYPFQTLCRWYVGHLSWIPHLEKSCFTSFSWLNTPVAMCCDCYSTQNYQHAPLRMRSDSCGATVSSMALSGIGRSTGTKCPHSLRMVLFVSSCTEYFQQVRVLVGSHRNTCYLFQ